MRRWTMAGVLAVGSVLAGCDSGETDLDASMRTDAFTPQVDSGSAADAFSGADAFFSTDAFSADAFAPSDDADMNDAFSPDAFMGSADAGMMMSASPASLGPFEVMASMTTIMRGSRTITVRVFLPALPAGARAPLVFFMPGFQLNGGQYTLTLQHLASHGFVVLGIDAPGTLFSVSHVAMAADARAVLDWATTTAPFAFVVDETLIGASGHSLGGKLATLVTMEDPRIDALLAIDPVDGDPSPFGGGSPDRPDLVPARGGDILVPAGFIGETVSAAGGFMPCAPAAQNFTQFYGAATAAPFAFQWDMTGADHMDFLDNPATCGFTCSVCADGPADDATIVANTRTLATAFFRRHLRAEAAMDATLTGASIPTGIVEMHRP